MRGFSVETENFVERGRGGNKGGTQQGGEERFCVVEELVGQDIYKYKENSMGGRGKNKKGFGVSSRRRSEMGPIWGSREGLGTRLIYRRFVGPCYLFLPLPVWIILLLTWKKNKLRWIVKWERWYFKMFEWDNEWGWKRIYCWTADLQVCYQKSKAITI